MLYEFQAFDQNQDRLTVLIDNCFEINSYSLNVDMRPYGLKLIKVAHWLNVSRDKNFVLNYDLFYLYSIQWYG